jgi:hypothetical protein
MTTESKTKCDFRSAVEFEKVPKAVTGMRRIGRRFWAGLMAIWAPSNGQETSAVFQIPEKEGKG